MMEEVKRDKLESITQTEFEEIVSANQALEEANLDLDDDG
jgi:hypothetical protein